MMHITNYYDNMIYSIDEEMTNDDIEDICEWLGEDFIEEPIEERYVNSN